MVAIESYKHLKINRYKCCYCGDCVGVCPKGALELIETWLEVDDTCTGCSICVKICPVGALEKIELEKPQKQNASQPLIGKP